MSLSIEAGDVCGVRGIGELSDLIVAATGNGPWSHCGTIVATAPFVMVCEALDRVMVRPLDVRLSDAAHVWIVKPPLTPDQRERAARRALEFVAQDYAYGNIIWQAMDALTQSRWFSEHRVRIIQGHEVGRVICSELDTESELTTIALPPNTASPNDIWGFAQVERWPIEQLK
jgi:hypothetical protein